MTDSRRHHLASEPILPRVEEHFRSLFKNMLNGLAYCKVLTDGPPPHDFVYLEVNEAFEAQTGLQDVAGKKASEAIPGIREEDPWLLNLYSEVARTGQPRKFERYVKALDEWFAVSVYSPETDYFVAVFDVTTKARVAEEALRGSEALLRRVLDGSTDGFGDFRAATGCVSVTPRYCEIYGLPLDLKEISAEALMAFVEPADLPPIQADMAAIAAGEKDDHMWEYRIRRADGTTRWVQSRGRVVGRDARGRPVHVSGAITDITERKQADEALKAAHAELRTALQSVKTLTGLLPICMYCKKIRDDAGYWDRMESYISTRTDARFSHGMCDACAQEHHGDLT